MALTPSTMMELGTPAPHFALPNVDGRTVTRSDYAGRPVVVMFICNHCPYVKHVAPVLADLAREYQEKGVGFVAINSNDADQYPDDAPDKMVEEVDRRGYPFPYLFDASQEVAKAFTAACTPDIFVFDREHRLYYRGQVDDTRPQRHGPGNYDHASNPATGDRLRHALDALLAGQEPPADQRPSIGCNIKWKPGREPEYATA